MTTFHLRNADPTLRLFITAFLLVLTAGYAIGLFFVDHTTSFTSQGIQEQLLGNENSAIQPEIKYAKSVNDMFIFIHNHVLSLALVFFAVGSIFYFSSIVSERVKCFLMVEPLVAIVTTLGGIVLVRYVSPHFSWLVIISGASLFLCYAVMLVLIIKELWFTR